MEKELERVRYKKSPLVEVVFQLRVPTILSINTNPPVDFQEKIREKYPLFEEQLEEAGDVIVNLDRLYRNFWNMYGSKNHRREPFDKSCCICEFVYIRIFCNTKCIPL